MVSASSALSSCFCYRGLVSVGLRMLANEIVGQPILLNLTITASTMAEAACRRRRLLCRRLAEGHDGLISKAASMPANAKTLVAFAERVCLIF